MTLSEVTEIFLTKLPEEQRDAFVAEFRTAPRGDARHKVVNKYGIHLSAEERKNVEGFFSDLNAVVDLLTSKVADGRADAFIAEFRAANPGDARHKVINKYEIHLNPTEREMVERFFESARLGVLEA